MIVVLMGVTGSGKTTVGKVLANQLGWMFCDADDYHPAANISTRGYPEEVGISRRSFHESGTAGQPVRDSRAA